MCYLEKIVFFMLKGFSLYINVCVHERERKEIAADTGAWEDLKDILEKN